MKTNQAVEGLVAAVMLGLVANAPAMPSKQEINKAQPLVAELMAPAMDDYKAKKKTAAEVADAAVAFAAKAETEAAKFMLYRSSIPYYVRGEAYDKAADAVMLLKSNVKDVPAEVVEEIISKATVRANKEKAPRLFELYRQAKTQATAEKDVRELRKKPATAANRQKLAEALATTGDWPEALKEFANLRTDAALIAKKEQNGSGKSYELGEFWWAYTPVYENAEDTFKVHAVIHYRKALASDEIIGLKKEIVERRVKEYEGAMEIACGSVTSSLARGLYCVIDLSGGPNAKKYPVSYLSDMPKDGWSDEYKTKKLVLRRVDPGKSVLVGRGERRHRTSVSAPYYLGVFEVTQGQWEQVTGMRPSFWRGKEYRKRPVQCVSYSMIRGKDKGSEWPESNAVDEESFLGLLRAKTGVDMDLPTDKQWEYACAAGTESDYNNGESCSDDWNNAAMGAVGRYLDNGGWDPKFGRCPIHGSPSEWNSKVRENDTKNGTAAVGSYVPNKWGLYDMHGNVWEWCLDWENGRDCGKRVVRGGWWADRAVECCTWIRKGWDPNEEKIMHGLRLCLPLSGGAAK